MKACVNYQPPSDCIALLPNPDDWCGMCRNSRGWWVISGVDFANAMTRAASGEDPDLLYAEYYANGDIQDVPPNGCDA